MALSIGKRILKKFAEDLEIRLRETRPPYSIFRARLNKVFFIDYRKKNIFNQLM